MNDSTRDHQRPRIGGRGSKTHRRGTKLSRRARRRQQASNAAVVLTHAIWVASRSRCARYHSLAQSELRSELLLITP
ncbi:hypothetical protein B0H12DRAFT_1097869 [Mycena haematopus]|nr:hypothetical protein B0H12DRAFT_1097869 [Mycena haematopus]